MISHPCLKAFTIDNCSTDTKSGRFYTRIERLFCCCSNVCLSCLMNWAEIWVWSTLTYETVAKDWGGFVCKHPEQTERETRYKRNTTSVFLCVLFTAKQVKTPTGWNTWVFLCVSLSKSEKLCETLSRKKNFSLPVYSEQSKALMSDKQESLLCCWLMWLFQVVCWLVCAGIDIYGLVWDF